MYITNTLVQAHSVFFSNKVINIPLGLLIVLILIGVLLELKILTQIPNTFVLINLEKIACKKYNAIRASGETLAYSFIELCSLRYAS